MLGLIFLKFADINYRRHEEAINAVFAKLKGGRREKPLHEIAVGQFFTPRLVVRLSFSCAIEANMCIFNEIAHENEPNFTALATIGVLGQSLS